MAYTIPETAVEIQTGLWLDIVQGTVRNYSRLYSGEGYCFYDVNDENREDGTRLYYRYTATPDTDVDSLNATYISVPIEEGFEIASEPNGTVTA